MRKRLYIEELQLEKTKKLPGPGYYMHADSVGSAQVCDSRMTNSSKYTLSKAEDRFRTGKFNVPAPDSYSP